MFGFIRRLFFRYWQKLKAKFQETKVEDSHNIPPSIMPTKQTKILSYNSNLIPVLEKDHPALLFLYASILRHANNKEYKALARGLNAFRERLKTHLRKESIDLYMYLEFVIVKSDEINLRNTFREFRLEMKGISVAVSSALNQYENTPITDKTVERFIIDFKGLGRILVDRIKREEKILYPIYLNLKNGKNI